MKRIVILVLFAMFLCFFSTPCFADEIVYDGVVQDFNGEYMKDLKLAIEQALSQTEFDDNTDFNFDNFMSEVTKGDVKFDIENIGQSIINTFFSEVKINIATAGLIIVVAFLIGICEALCNESGQDAIQYVGVFIITGLLVEGFARILTLVSTVFNNAMGFMDVLLPSILAVMVASGHIGISSTFSPVMYTLMQLVAFAFRSVLIPVITLMFFMSVLSSMSGNMNFSRMYEFVKHICKWTTGIVFTVFISVTGFYAMMSSAIEGLAGKALKQTVSGMVPVVGAMIADTTDLVVGSLSIIKNGVGMLGMIVVVIICLTPIIKVFAVNIIYRFTSAVIEPITSKNIIEMIWSAAETFNYFTAVLAGLMVMLVLSIAIVLNAANASVMYR